MSIEVDIADFLRYFVVSKEAIAVLAVLLVIAFAVREPHDVELYESY